MVGRSREGSSGGRRCACGHYPTTHLRVVAATGSPGSFALEPTGACQVCGETVCRRYTPSTGADRESG